ncbi:MAG: VTC domain-containing protein [Solirubrobacteraceae bacterium]
MSDALGEAVTRLAPVSLDELDARAALRRRVDAKYVVPRERLAGVIDRVAECYEVLEIDGLRVFSYESVYLDTPDLRCFRDRADHGRLTASPRARSWRVRCLRTEARDRPSPTASNPSPSNQGRTQCSRSQDPAG